MITAVVFCVVVVAGGGGGISVKRDLDVGRVGRLGRCSLPASKATGEDDPNIGQSAKCMERRKGMMDLLGLPLDGAPTEHMISLGAVKMDESWRDLQCGNGDGRRPSRP